MKDGISTMAKIVDLVSEMQKLEDAVVLNKDDLLRQCSSAANTLAITQDEECLQHFVQLDGVGFLTQWLLDAQNCSKDITGSAEDLVLAILTALHSLPDSAQATSCGVLPTVQNLLVHANTKVNQKAKISMVYACLLIEGLGALLSLMGSSPGRRYVATDSTPASSLPSSPCTGRQR